MGASTENAHKILDEIVDKCEADIKSRNLPPREALKIIGSNISRAQFTFENNHSTYAEALFSKKFDCDQFAITYLTVCRRLKLPVYAVLMPQHMAIVWDDRDNVVLWETTINAEKDSSDYIKDFHIQS
ncbi:MAG: hypothetical protein WDO15_09615 [Bacteroidota bacterium]